MANEEDNEKDKVVDSRLIVESRFATRKKLVRDLENLGGTINVIEARSVADGLNTLRDSPITSCLLGPTLSKDVAVDFLKEGKNLSKNSQCAFVAVVRDDFKSFQELYEAGAHGTIKSPYNTENFSIVVNRALNLATTTLKGIVDPRLQTQIQELEQAESELLAFHRTVNDEAIETDELPELLKYSAKLLRQVAGSIGSGEFMLRDGGMPSLAILDAINLALQPLLSNGEEPMVLGNADLSFIDLMADWFEDRVTHTAENATERLRQRLRAQGHQA